MFVKRPSAHTKWVPALARPSDAITPSDTALIRAKFPKAPDGGVYVDAVFEGGGVKGLAFVGALRCFDDAGIRMRKVAGTSAGAITAASVAAGLGMDELETSLGGFDFASLLSRKTRSWWPFWGGSSMSGLGMASTIVGLVLSGTTGRYSSGPLLDWVTALLKGRLDTFAAAQSGAEWHEQRDLRVVVTDISAGEIRVLPNDLALYQADRETFSVAEAVRLSMSIPFFFEPGRLGDSVVVDGGVLSSFPLWMYDKPAGVVPMCPTIGFMVSDRSSGYGDIETAADMVGALVGTMALAADRKYARDHDQHRIVRIDTLGVEATRFTLDDATKTALYRSGYAAAKHFLMEGWDWEVYLASRAEGAKL